MCKEFNQVTKEEFDKELFEDLRLEQQEQM